MESTVGWIDLSPLALRKLRHDLEDKPDGVVDEMGVLALHTGYADRFFPGTSVLHKRPRYTFFTCWNYLLLDEVEGTSPTERKEIAERWVRDQLIAAKQSGVIGARVERPAQPVDFIYWTALNRWGFYRGPSRTRLLSKWSAELVMRVDKPRPVDENPYDEPGAAFLVPKPPHYWLKPRPRSTITFDLSLEEARFLQTRLRSLPACMLATAALLARKSAPTGDMPWTDPLLQEAAVECREHGVLERAQRASSLGLLIRAMYGALVERRRNTKSSIAKRRSIKDPKHYLTILCDLFFESDDVPRQLRALSILDLERDLPRLQLGFRKMIKHVKERADRVRYRSDVERHLLDDITLELFSDEELDRKRELARLPDNTFGDERREDFDEGTVTVAPIDYRWNVVKTLLEDLHRGLRRRA